MSDRLKDGMDSGDVSDRVKLQIFVKGAGICAAPDCEERLMQNRTRLGECAHIIPRRVGSHPREDYTTLLEDRRKEPNLLYLCDKHHDFADDKQHAELYTAELLRNWKKEHETWAAGISKNSPYLPPEFKAMLARVEKEFAEQAHTSSAIIGKLLDACHELLHRQLISEARVFLSQIDLLLVGADNASLNVRADLLNAILSIRNEKIPEAKQQLLQIIQANPHYVEALLEYIELCDHTSEPGDESESVEKLARGLASDHPRFLLIDLARKYQKHEVVEPEDISVTWADDVRLNARFLCQYAIFCDIAQKPDQRDTLINRWEAALPTSPRPHFFRVLFRTSELFSAPIKETRPLLELLEFSRHEREQASAKDPLTIRDRISWRLHDLRLELVLAEISQADTDLGEIRNDLVSQIERCYFDRFINDMLPALLGNLHIEPDQWRAITQTIQKSTIPPSHTVVELLFFHALQCDDLHAELGRFADRYGHSDLLDILNAIAAGEAEKLAEIVNAKQNSTFALYLLQSIADHDLALALTERLEVNTDDQVDLLFARLRFLDEKERDEEAVNLLPRLPIHNAAPFALQIMERVAYRNAQWHLFVPVALRLLDFEIAQTYRGQLYAELATAYFEQGDDSNVIPHAEEALNQPIELGEKNSQILLSLLGQSLSRKDKVDEACKKFQQYGHVKRSFPILLQEAELYLRSSFADKYEKALALIVRAFEEADVYTDELYLAALMPLIELSNARIIPLPDEPVVNDGLFVKLDGFSHGWFYLGEESNSLGAECIRPGSSTYAAVIHKAVADDIAWPPDKFSKPQLKRKILHIASAAAFLAHRANEAMTHAAEIGTGHAWAIHMANEDGSFDIENLIQFMREHFQPENDFFDTYTKTPLPFSFLTVMHSGLSRALGRIVSERKGFIRSNDGTQADIDGQRAVAVDVLQGTTCFIDGLSALMLAEAGLLEAVIAALPQLGVSTSVIRLLRDLAGDLASITHIVGEGSLVDGAFRFSHRNKDSYEAYKKHLLRSADLLDKLPNKVIGKTYPKSKEDGNLDHLLPDYFVDAFRYSQEREAHILTDDALSVQAYKLLGEPSMPRHFSSLSLIRAMAETKQIAWDAYFNYFARLSHYRYYFLPISVDDMIQAVFPVGPSGLVKSAPKNIGLLNLPLTLSEEYGVNETTATRVLALFFSRLIQDETVPFEIADEIFALTIKQSLAKRDRRIMARAIFQFCQENARNSAWPSATSKKKLENLDKQLFGFAQGFDPIVIDSSLLLRATHSKSDDSNK